MKKLVTTVFLSSTLIGCAVTGPAEDTWDEELKDPRLIFSEGLQNGGDTTNTKKKASSSQNSNYPYIDTPAIGQESFKEFEEFKAWRRAKQSGSAESQEYQDWQAYQQYRRFKAQQQKPEPALAK